MKRFNKMIILVIILSTSFLITGCDKISFGIFNESEEGTTSEATKAPENNQNQNAINENTDNKASEGNDNADNGNASANTTEDISPTASALASVANDELPIYNVNAESGNIEPVTALIPEESKLTPELIVNTVVEAMADQSIIIGIDSVTTDKDAVIVSFTKDKAPYQNMGSGYEAAILDAIAQSLLDNLPDYNNVIYRVEGKEYVSGVFELGIDEVYMKR